MTQLELDLHEGEYARVRDWTVRLVPVDRTCHGAARYAVRVQHASGADWLPGWRLSVLTLDAAYRAAEKAVEWLETH